MYKLHTVMLIKILNNVVVWIVRSVIFILNYKINEIKEFWKRESVPFSIGNSIWFENWELLKTSQWLLILILFERKNKIRNKEPFYYFDKLHQY